MKKVHEELKPHHDIKFTYHNQEIRHAGIIAPLQYHEFIEILYCISGEFIVTVNGYEYQFLKGDMIFINSRQLHEIVLKKKSASNKYIVFKVSPEIIFKNENSNFEIEKIKLFLYANTANSAHISASEFKNYDIEFIINKLIKEFENNKYCKDMAIGIYFHELLLILMRIWNKRGNILPVQVKGKHLSEQFYDIFNFINNNYSENLTASYVAKKFYMSYTYFSQIFKRITSLNFTKYINYVRISEAENLLLNTDYSTTEIAGKVGFSSVSYFIKTFKEYKNMSPQKFRKFVRNNDVGE